jgi:hypothetical protein
MKFAAIKIFTCIALAGMLLSSCSRFAFEHRRYRPGYHISWSGPAKHNVVKCESAEVENSTVKILEENEASALTAEIKPACSVNHFSENSLRPSEKISPRKKIRLHTQKTLSISKKNSGTKQDRIIIPEKHRKDKNSFYGISGLIALFTVAFAFSQRKRLVKVSRWSARNARLSRWFQFAGHICLSTAAFLSGSMLYLHDVVAGPAMVPISMSVFVLTAMVYPRRRRREPITPGNFMKAKMADLSLILSASLFWAATGNHIAEKYSSQQINGASAVVWQSIASLSGADDNHDTYISSPEKKSGLSGGQVTAIIFVVFAFILSILFLAAVACTLVCSGSAMGAIFLGVFGFLLLTGSLIASIRAIVARHTPVVSKPTTN